MQNGRWSASEGHLLWSTTVCTLPVGRRKFRYTDVLERDLKALNIRGRYGELGTTDIGASFLALSSTRQTSIFDSNVHHRLQSSLN